jgi:hypothetical protein
MAGFCEHGNELSSSTKGGGFIDRWQADSALKMFVFNEVMYILSRIFKTENFFNDTDISNNLILEQHLHYILTGLLWFRKSWV